MEDQSRIFGRRKSIRLKIICLAMYTRFDKMGRPADQKPCRTVNLSLGGVKLQTGFPVNPGEVLDVSMVLGENSITFKGTVIYVNPSRDEDFEEKLRPRTESPSVSSFITSIPILKVTKRGK